MTGPATGSVFGAAGLATAMAFMPFGVSFSTLVLGGMCYFAGSCARTGLKLSKLLDGTDALSLQAMFRPIVALLFTIPIASVASCVLFLAAHVLNIEADAACGGLLLILGARGPEGFQWLMDSLTNTFSKIIPGKKPEGNGP